MDININNNKRNEMLDKIKKFLHKKNIEQDINIIFSYAKNKDVMKHNINMSNMLLCLIYNKYIIEFFNELIILNKTNKSFEFDEIELLTNTDNFSDFVILFYKSLIYLYRSSEQEYSLNKNIFNNISDIKDYLKQILNKNILYSSNKNNPYLYDLIVLLKESLNIFANVYKYDFSYDDKNLLLYDDYYLRRILVIIRYINKNNIKFENFSDLYTDLETISNIQYSFIFDINNIMGFKNIDLRTTISEYIFRYGNTIEFLLENKQKKESLENYDLKFIKNFKPFCFHYHEYKKTYYIFINYKNNNSNKLLINFNIDFNKIMHLSIIKNKELKKIENNNDIDNIVDIILDDNILISKTIYICSCSQLLIIEKYKENEFYDIEYGVFLNDENISIDTDYDFPKEIKETVKKYVSLKC